MEKQECQNCTSKTTEWFIVMLKALERRLTKHVLITTISISMTLEVLLQIMFLGMSITITLPKRGKWQLLTGYVFWMILLYFCPNSAITVYLENYYIVSDTVNICNKIKVYKLFSMLPFTTSCQCTPCVNCQLWNNSLFCIRTYFNHC